MNALIISALALLCAPARAQWVQRDASEGVATIVAPGLEEIVTRLDAMLPAPTLRFDAPIDPSMDLVDALAGAPARYVVLVRPSSVQVVDRVDRRIVERALEEGLVAREPYVAAMVVVELLEVVGAVRPADDPAPEEPVVETPPPVEPTETAPVEPPPRPTLELVTGGVVTRGLGTGPSTLSAAMGIDVDVPLRGFVLSLGADLRFPGKVDLARTTSSGVDVRFDYARSDFGVRAAFGADGERFAYRVHAVMGPSRVHVRARTQETVSRTGEDARATGFLGVGLEGRVALVPSVWLAARAGIEWLLGATPYGALGELLVDEPHFRVVGSVVLVWRIGL